MNSPRIGASTVSPRLGGLAGMGTAPAGMAAPAAPVVGTVPAAGLAHIRYASTWPRGWMAAAVAQQVREFNAQVSRAQMALDFLRSLADALKALDAAGTHQQQLPSAAGLGRWQQALHQVQSLWSLRHRDTLGSVDECLAWSATGQSRKHFGWLGWSWNTLRAQHVADKELISLCLMGQADAHGAWQAEFGRSDAASRYHLAVALAALRIQLGRSDQPLSFSVDERWWPVLQERLMVKGNGQRWPAGQWVHAPLQANPQALPVAQWAVVDGMDAVQAAEMRAQVADARSRTQQALDAVQRFVQDAGSSLLPTDAQRLHSMQAFAQAFSSAGQAPAYDWVLAVVPAVRAISRLRVRRLLKTTGALG